MDERKERAILVGVMTPKNRAYFQEMMEELEQLVKSADAEPVFKVVQKRRSYDPRYLVGKGKAQEIARLVDELDADLVVFLNKLSPAQHRNLEEIINAKVIDRVALILDIFAQRARTIEGKLQVELAQLTYILPRLVGYGKMLSRLGGGIGTRGPGLTKLEVERRKILRRIHQLRRRIEEVRKVRATQRAKRRRSDILVVTVIGYTNAGKSTLFNYLTKSKVYVDNRAFATLDPTVRRLYLPKLKELGKEVLMVDTVGFIRDLPQELLAAFKATFEELEEADIFLHLVDASSPNFRDHIEAVERILIKLDLDYIPKILAFNKIDLLDEKTLEELKMSYPNAVFISARTGEGIDELLEVIQGHLLKLLESDLYIEGDLNKG